MKRHNIDLTEGVIWKQLIVYAFPLLLSNLLQQFYNTTDLMIVGQFAGDRAMAAIGATGSVTSMLISLFVGLSTGASVVVAQAYGGGDHPKLSRAIHSAYAIAVSGGLMLAVAAHFLARPVLLMMQTPLNIIDDAVLYTRIYFYGALPLLIYNVCAGIMRAVGDSRRPFYFLIISAISNIFLDLIFVAIIPWGAAGAAFATVLAQIIAAVVSTYSLSRSNTPYRLNLSAIRFHKAEMSQILKIGVPTGLQSVLISFSNVLLQAEVNLYGHAAIAGVAAANRYDAFLNSASQSFVMASTTFTGQNVGAGKFERLRQGTRTSLKLVGALWLSLGALLFVLAEPLMNLFSPDAQVVYYGVRKMRIVLPFQIIFNISSVLGGIIRGAGQSLIPMLVTLFGMFGVRIFLIKILTPLWHSIDVVFWSYPISWAVTLLIMASYYRYGNWLKSSVVYDDSTGSFDDIPS